MRQALISVLLVAMVVLSGCSALEDTGGGQSTLSAAGTPVETATPTQTETGMETAQFETSVTYPNGGVAGNESVVDVTVENTGDAEGEYEATLTADGETVDSETVTLAAGASTAVSLTHTFETTGQHDLSVGAGSKTIQVYGSPFEFTDAAMERVETARTEESSTLDGTIRLNRSTFDVQVDSSSTIRKNFTAETQSTNETTSTTVFGQTSVEQTESWIVDGTRYARTVDEDGVRNYTREPSDEFEDSGELENDAILDYLGTDHTDEEYVLVVETESSAEATELIQSFGGDGSDGLSAESIDEFYLEIRYDRQTGRTTETQFRFSGSGGESFESFEFTLSEEYVAFNETVSVEVPQEVRDRATRSGTTVESDARASLALAKAV